MEKLKECVYNACMGLLHNIKIDENVDHPYCGPFMNYVMLWPEKIPIHTIIIGQNPYPQDIYPDYGSALAYDPLKSKDTPKSVLSIAKDLYNYDGSDINTTIECFRDSWRLLDIGILMINECVFDKIKRGHKTNTGSIKEMESQLRALQTIITASYFLGQQSFTVLSMGIPSSEMASILRAWIPKDVISIRVITCRNPAARIDNEGDLPSHGSTLGKTAAIKLLSSIVLQYSKMSTPKTSQADKRRQQNSDALDKAAKVVNSTGTKYESEIKSFQQRLQEASGNQEVKATIEELSESLGSLMKCVESHRNAISSHSMTMIMAMDSFSKDKNANSATKSGATTPNITSLNIPSGPRRRVVKHSAGSTTQESIPEKDEPIDTEYTPSIASRPRRRTTRRQSYAPSETGTEYTVESNATQNADPKGEDMSVLESSIMRHYAAWCKKNKAYDTTYGEILSVASETKSVSNEFTKKVLDYIRLRRDRDIEYDAYDEFTQPDSDTIKWMNNLLSDP